MCDRGIPSVTERQDSFFTVHVLMYMIVATYGLNNLSALSTKTCKFRVIFQIIIFPSNGLCLTISSKFSSILACV